MKEANSRKIDAHKVIGNNSTEENKMCKGIKIKARKAVSKAMREKAEEVLTEYKKINQMACLG